MWEMVICVRPVSALFLDRMLVAVTTQSQILQAKCHATWNFAHTTLTTRTVCVCNFEYIDFSFGMSVYVASLLECL
jgi:hypothetical protein